VAVRVFHRTRTRLRLFIVLPMLLPLFVVGCDKKGSSADGEYVVPLSDDNVEGNVDELSFERISGWAWDRTHPDKPIQVDIFDHDKKLDRVTANHYREDLVDEKKGNGEHAFKYYPPAKLKDGKIHKIQVRVSGTSKDLCAPKKLFLKSP